MAKALTLANNRRSFAGRTNSARCRAPRDKAKGGVQATPGPSLKRHGGGHALVVRIVHRKLVTPLSTDRPEPSQH